MQDDRVQEIREFWDADAATYDGSTSHHPQTALELAAWSAALERLLPPAPARVLDVGAGTGFLSLLAAALGHRVTALDLSAQMLERLREKAAAQGLDVHTLEGAAEAARGRLRRGHRTPSRLDPAHQAIVGACGS